LGSRRNKVQIKFRECLQPCSSESFVFASAILHNPDIVLQVTDISCTLRADTLSPKLLSYGKNEWPAKKFTLAGKEWIFRCKIIIKCLFFMYCKVKSVL
jgi:hypothetical protein